ncbi:MAG: hypothetical protein ISS54_00055 [Dehalococcoidia bacterium]|nr:hypothetical protein [Dehalococcoidia bacterium]
MPAIRDIPLSLKTGEVLRRQGFRGHSKIRPEIKNLILELLATVENTHLLEPAVAYEYYQVTGMSSGQVSLEGDKAIHGSLLPTIFPEAKELAALVCTIGPKLEKQVTDYSKSGETLRGMILDGIGSAAVDMLAPEACRLIASRATSHGHQTSSPVSPGWPGLPLTEQWNLFELVNTQEIGVSLTASGIMVPRKSVSMVIGIGPQMATWTRAEVCTRCSLRKTCPYRIQA